jgi:hypothetical protein
VSRPSHCEFRTTGYSRASSTFDTIRSRMRGLELITYPARGIVRIAPWLYP